MGAEQDLLELEAHGERMRPQEDEHGPDFMQASMDEADARHRREMLGPGTPATTEALGYGRGVSSPRILCRQMSVSDLLSD